MPVKLLQSHLAALYLHLRIVQQERFLFLVQQPFVDRGLKLPSGKSPKDKPEQGKLVGDLEVDQAQHSLLLKHEAVVADSKPVLIDDQVSLGSPNLECLADSHLQVMLYCCHSPGTSDYSFDVDLCNRFLTDVLGDNQLDFARLALRRLE